MKIEYTQTFQDIKSFYQFHGWYSDERKFYRIRTRIIYGLIPAVSFVAILLLADADIKSPIGVFFLFLIFFSMGFFVARPSKLAYWEGLAKRILKDKLNSHLLGYITVDFQSDQIIWKREASEGQTKSESIKKIKVDGNYYYLYDSSFSAWIIPKSVFKDSKHIEEFEGIIKNYC